MFLLAKTYMLSEGSSPEDTMKHINEAISIEEEIQQSKPIKNSILGRYYYCAGTILQGHNDFSGALKNYLAASEILKHLQGLEGLIEELNKQIEACSQMVQDTEKPTEG